MEKIDYSNNQEALWKNKKERYIEIGIVAELPKMIPSRQKFNDTYIAANAIFD